MTAHGALGQVAGSADGMAGVHGVTVRDHAGAIGVPGQRHTALQVHGHGVTLVLGARAAREVWYRPLQRPQLGHLPPR